MCRHLAYLGPPASLSRWLFEPPHSLARQASAPCDMRGGGVVNVDGFGVGWYPQPGAPPRSYRRALPVWSDPYLPQLAADTCAPAALAAIRSATPGMPVNDAACAPFGSGRWLFSLNGRIAGWPGSVAGLAATLPAVDLLTMTAPTDSAFLWSLLRHRLAAGQAPAAVVGALVREVLAAAPDSRLNLLLTDSHTIIATTVTHSLSVLRQGHSVLVSSEPLDDDPGWEPVADGRLLVASQSGVDVTALPV